MPRLPLCHPALAVLASVPFAIPAIAQTAADVALQVEATAATNPPTLTFSWPASATATSYTVARRPAGDLFWGNQITVPGGGAATSWIDSNVVLGERYEYRFLRLGSTVARGLVTAGVEAAAIEDRGVLVLIVDATQATALAAGIDRLVEDMNGDGWRVLRHDVQPTDPVTSVKATILADYNADPTNVRAVFLLGHVPVPYSGNIAPDGHSNHIGAWAADVYYGEVDGVWTDSTVNNSSASRTENRNVPGDGKFDQSVVPNNVELMVGRVDLANMPAFAASETQLLQQYLDKDHDYRHKVFAADQRAVIDDNFGYFSGEAFAASGWRAFSALVGTANVVAGDYFTTLNTTSGGGHVWSYGCGGGSYTSAGGIGTTTDFTTSANRGVFTMLFGSYFGDWDSTNNFLRAPLCSGWTLSNAWAGRPHWSFHPMGLGETLGFCARYSQNDTTAGGFSLRGVHVALMGDPTLRQHVIAPAANVSITGNTAGSQATIAWSASPDAAAGYHVYRATTTAGPFVRLTTGPVATTSFVDSSPPLGDVTYAVRALRLETVPTGSYWNLSQSAFASTCLPQVPASHTSFGTGCYQIGSTPAIALSASPPPISTPTTGTLVTYTVDDVPENAPGSGAYNGFVIVSLQGDLPGTSLAAFGAPGCTAYLASLDLWLAFAGSSPTETVQFQVPAGAPCGLPIYAAALAFVQPFSQNGQNAAGIVTSNGVESIVSPY
ncbi:MAG: fibronectin type III domain-containing protein [Planctomycetes bacterium]|nr:fibronectin type III domain-containing protein [Planctomycetota bacterium]